LQSTPRVGGGSAFFVRPLHTTIMIKVTLVFPKTMSNHGTQMLHMPAWMPVIPCRGDCVEVRDPTPNATEPRGVDTFRVEDICYTQLPDDRFEVTVILKAASRSGAQG